MLKIAHRGASGYEPENTLASFKKATQLHADMIECDVRLCKTGEVVVIHDGKVDRTTNGHGKVKNHTLQELQKLDAGKGEKIPTLEEVFTLVKNRIKLNINVKELEAMGPTLELVEEYKKKYHIPASNVIISTEKIGIFRSFYQSKTITIVPLLFIFPRLILKFIQKRNPRTIGVYKHVVSKNLVEIAHALGIKVYVWTVNDPKEIERMKSMKVDGIISDYPDII